MNEPRPVVCWRAATLLLSQLLNTNILKVAVKIIVFRTNSFMCVKKVYADGMTSPWG